MEERPLFQDTDENDPSLTEGQDDTESGSVVAGMSQMPGSGASGLDSGRMAPPITVDAADEAVEEESGDDAGS